MFIDSLYHFCELLVHITTYFYIRFMLSLLNHTFSSMLLTLTLCQTFCQHLPSFFIFLSHELTNQQISTFLYKQGSWLSLCYYCRLCAGESGWLPRWLSGKESSAKQETWIQSLGWADSLEKEMATHSSLLAWEMPWTEEPGGLQPTRLQESGATW